MIIGIILTTFLSFVFIKLIIRYAVSLHLIDIPNDRSTHSIEKPLGAGVGFILAMLSGSLFYDFHTVLAHWYIYLALLMVLAVGLWDDMYHVSPKVKIIVISLAVILLWRYDISIDTLGSYDGKEITLGWLALPFTLFAVVGFTNSLNLIDGIDGLASMVSFLILGFFGYIGYEHSDVLMLTLSGFTLAGLFVFILFNYHPAKIFMGDSGSLSLGFIITVLAMLSLKYIHPMVAIYFTALPLYDTLIVVIRRIKKGHSILSPDKTHIHHIVLRYFGDRDFAGKRTNGNRRTAWLLVFVQLLFSVVGLVFHWMIPENPQLPIIALIGFLLGFIILYKAVVMIEMKSDNSLC